MIIIQLAGGLGNQMFQYALYLQLKSLGKNVKIDDVAGFAQDEKRNPALYPFDITYECASKKELVHMLDSSPLPWSRLRRKLCGRKKKAYFEADKCFHPEIMTWDDIYLEGYWQTEKYFADISDDIKKIYDTDKLLQYIRDNNLTGTAAGPAAHAEETDYGRMTMDGLLARIETTESVSVHIRRGDYLLPENLELFGDICTESYYENAMEQMKSERPDCRFYLFTNDKEWLKGQIVKRTETNMQNADKGFIDDIEVVDLGEQSDYAEFVLMSKCKHNILANSSFSWWASYLNHNPNKIVLAPDRWLNGWDCKDLYRNDMRKVNAG
ncbi:MAG: alpha-1,2-fucosyltransferase [Lachnospiraceae bacterium]|nr:alpha-1,2-fucosyltransferase [Lachnospiraceae bacterium]